MGFNRDEIRVKATNISVVDRKGGESILGCQVVSGAISCYCECPFSLARRFFAPNYAGDWWPYGGFTWHAK